MAEDRSMQGRGRMSIHVYARPKMSLLCAEDDQLSRNLLSRIITKKFPDIELLLAEDGKSGLDIFRERTPGIVITDLRMPLMDGIQMAAEIKAMSPETIIIVVSAYSDTHYLLKAIEIGINHYVMKPVEHTKLVAAIEKSIAEINLFWQVKTQEAEIQQLASFTQISPNPVIETDITGELTYYNEATAEALRNVGRNKEWALFFPADMSDILAMFREDKSDRVNREVKINGSYFEENIHFARQFEKVRIYATDITERKKMQEELLKAQKLESLGLVAGGIAHGFNNILTAILGNLSLARMQLNPCSDVTRRLKECEKAALQASELARQLLTFSIGGEPAKKPIDPVPLIRNAVSLVLLGTNVRSVLELTDELWPVEADSGQFSQALQNLLINSLQAMPSGGEVAIRAANETLGEDNPHGLSPGDYLRISVEDHGCGIPQDNLAKIFDPYFTTKPLGTGLGLSAVYSILKRHGGTVEVSSTVGKGSCFTLHMPAMPGCQVEDDAVNFCVEPQGNCRVLIMDDEELIREIASEILAFAGYEVESCADGMEALRRYREAREQNVPFHAVILDLTVPGGMGGKEAAAQLLQMDPQAVLIVSSGYCNDPVVANYREYGFSGAISKPFDAETLAMELERLLPRKERGVSSNGW
ncbi:MAG TPA: response regulator [Geobacteraceae bacterium]